MELLTLSVNGKENIKIELNEIDIVGMTRHSYFHKRNLTLGNKLINLLCAINSITRDELINNWDRLYK